MYVRDAWTNIRIPLNQKEWLYGINPVLEALRAGRNIKKVYICAGKHKKVLQVKQEAEIKAVLVETVSHHFFDSQFPKGHQGVAALASSKTLIKLDDLLELPLKRNEAALFLILDCLEDPRNLGAIIRSAEAAGVHGIIFGAYRCVGLGSAVAKASAGAVEYLPVTAVPNIKHAIHQMKENKIMVIGVEADAPTSLWEVDLAQPIAVVVGSEGKGIRKTVKEYCDLIVSLPMKGRINSLNVSVATGILLFEILRQRQGISKKSIIVQ